MSIIVKLPHFNEAAETYTIGRLCAHHGQWVNADDILCEVESDKVVYEVCAEQAGHVHFLVKEGDTVRVEEAICTITPNPNASAEAVQSHSINTEHQTLYQQEEYRKVLATHEIVKTLEVSGHINRDGLLVLDRPLAVHNIPNVKIIVIYTTFE